MVTQTDIESGLTRHDQQCNWTKTIDKEEKKRKATASHFWKFEIFLPTHIWHICKAPQANALPKLCKRAKFHLRSIQLT